MSIQIYIRLRPLLLALLSSTAVVYPLSASELSGKTVRVSTSATALGEDGTRVLQAPGDIFQGDLITTDKGGEAQIIFLDDTRFVIGPGSRVTIDEFVFKPNGTAASVGISALEGTFRFIGGLSPDKAYAIRTPTATVGIRGTALDFAVGSLGETTILWQEGSGWICVVLPGLPATSPRDDCRDVEVGDMVAAPPGGGFAAVSPEAMADLIYANSQASLATEFQLASAGGRPAPAPPPRFTQPRGTYQ